MKRCIYVFFFLCVSRCLQCRMKRRLILVCSVRWDVRYFKRTGAWRQWCVHADMCSFFSCLLALICFLLSLFLLAWLVCFCTHHYASHSWMYLLYYYTYIYIANAMWIYWCSIKQILINQHHSDTHLYKCISPCIQPRPIVVELLGQQEIQIVMLLLGTCHVVGQLWMCSYLK